MRRSIIAAIASFTILAFAPSSQAGPLIRGGEVAAAAAQSNVQQVQWGYGWRHRHWGYRYSWGHRYPYWGWRHHWGPRYPYWGWGQHWGPRYSYWGWGHRYWY